MLGIVCDIVMMLLFKRPVLMLLAETVIAKAPRFWGVPKEVAKTGPRLPRRGVPPVPRFNIDFMGNATSCSPSPAVLLVVSIGALADPRACTFGVEFRAAPSSTSSTPERSRSSRCARRSRTPASPTPQVQDERPSAAARASSCAPRSPSPTGRQRGRDQGRRRHQAARAATFQVTTIGPGWGKNVTNRALLALGALDRRDPALRLGAVRVQDVGHGGRRARPRHPDHARHLRAGRPGGHAQHHRGAAHDPRLLALRHDRGVPPHQGELAGPRRSSRS